MWAKVKIWPIEGNFEVREQHSLHGCGSDVSEGHIPSKSSTYVGLHIVSYRGLLLYEELPL
jgi:hypothetical protein